MSISKTIGTLIATVLVGSLTFLFSAPKKALKNKLKTTKTSTQKAIEEKDNLFI